MLYGQFGGILNCNFECRCVDVYHVYHIAFLTDQVAIVT